MNYSPPWTLNQFPRAVAEAWLLAWAYCVAYRLQFLRLAEVKSVNLGSSRNQPKSATDFQGPLSVNPANVWQSQKTKETTPLVQRSRRWTFAANLSYTKNRKIWGFFNLSRSKGMSVCATIWCCGVFWLWRDAYTQRCFCVIQIIRRIRKR